MGLWGFTCITLSPVFPKFQIPRTLIMSRNTLNVIIYAYPEMCAFVSEEEFRTPNVLSICKSVLLIKRSQIIALYWFRDHFQFQQDIGDNFHIPNASKYIDIITISVIGKEMVCSHIEGSKNKLEVQYIPRNMHTVFALLCFVVVIHWLIFPYPSGLLHWHCGNLTIAPVPAKQPWWIWINTSFEFIMNDYITTTKQSTTKPCAYFLGYTVRKLFPIKFDPVQITKVFSPQPWHYIYWVNYEIQNVFSSSISEKAKLWLFPSSLVLVI